MGLANANTMSRDRRVAAGEVSNMELPSEGGKDGGLGIGCPIGRNDDDGEPARARRFLFS